MSSTNLSSEARYPTHIFYSEEDGGFIATAPDLPGSSAFGETQQQALAELQHAVAAWIEAAQAAGNPIRGTLVNEHSQQMIVQPVHERQAEEIRRLRELLRGVGANRYWEGRWRDAENEIGRLRAALKEIADYSRPQIADYSRPRSVTEQTGFAWVRLLARRALEQKP